MRYFEYKVGDHAVLKGYLHEDFSSSCITYKDHPAVIVCPGGAYAYLSPREQDPVVMPLFSAGFQVFVLLYSTGQENIILSEPEKEIATAVSMIKAKSDELCIEKDKIAVLGFSAGGHLAASICCHWNRYGDESRPDCGILCYPVITMGKFCNERSKDNLTYGKEDRVKYFSLENEVTSDTVPCFIWHTTEDKDVPVQNSLMFVNALVQNDIPFEYHLYEKGRHGLAAGHRETGTEEKGVQSWLPLCIDWLYRRWDFTL